MNTTILQNELRYAESKHETIKNRFERDQRKGIVQCLWGDWENTSKEDKDRWNEVVIAARYANEIQGILTDSHENVLNIVCYEEKDIPDFDYLKPYIEKAGSFNRWTIGAIFRKEENDPKGIDSKYSVIREVADASILEILVEAAL
ncbi:MAG: hypothetical protein Q4P18_07025 [Methanobrevibacter sp.]|uniref:hypothetical protein n=1 Tax=Methanobrevibacter sp. TaxID=66852 RepID=UPI0026DF1197|nr:hypothetical protein [Methanobrevibacter sp.]MDO5849269.1 hypothetical protein [Methanobrevibacter sp.]